MIKNTCIRDLILFFLGSTGVLLGIFLTNIFRDNTIHLLFFIFILLLQIFYFFPRIFWFGCVFVCFFSLGCYISMHKWLDVHTNAEKFERETISFTADVLIKGTIVEKISENNKGARYVLRDMTIGTQKFPSNV